MSCFSGKMRKDGGVLPVEAKLLSAYKNIFKSKNNNPAWAIHKSSSAHSEELIHCPIPFVGNQYQKQDVKILLYASAENLSDYNSKQKTYLDEDDFAIVRHRKYFETTSEKSDCFYPNVHIQPINDGGLLIVAFYIFCKLHGIVMDMPCEFLERISVANYCKYTIQPPKEARQQNIDYPDNLKCLEESHEYIKSDIKILKPDYIILPKKIYQTDYKFINEIKGNAKIIPIYQINAKTINFHICKKYPQMDLEKLDTIFRVWYEQLGRNGINGITKQNFLSVFTYLEDVLKNEIR